MKQKIIITVIIFLFLSPSMIHAQKLKAKIGIKAGINLATIKNEDPVTEFSPSMKPDIMAGAELNIRWGFRNELSGPGTGITGIQAEVLYSRQGFSEGETQINLNYLSIPLLLKIYPTSTLSLEAGPVLGFLVSVSPENHLLNGTEIPLSELKEGGSKDAGITIGMGYDLNKMLHLGLRYTLGMSYLANNLEWKNNTFTLSAGWFF